MVECTSWKNERKKASAWDMYGAFIFGTKAFSRFTKYTGNFSLL